MIMKFIEFILNLFAKRNDETIILKKENSKYYYTKKALLTETEIKFYEMLKQIIADDFIIESQIPLASVINKKGNYRYQNELYRSIDFGIFNKLNYQPLLLIELNDDSHNNTRRRKRDISVKTICESAEIELMTFWVNKPNEYIYVRERILEALNKNKVTEIINN